MALGMGEWGDRGQGECRLAFSVLPMFSKTGQNDCSIGMQGPACSGNCGIYKTKCINKLSIQEAEFNNCLINKSRQAQEKRGKPMADY